MMDEEVGGNALRLAGEVFVPGAAQLVSGNIGSGILHNLLAGVAGVALVSTGVAPVLGSLAILGVKLNSYASATSGRSLWDLTLGGTREEDGLRAERPSRATSPGKPSPAAP